jgi:hypothetical protein
MLFNIPLIVFSSINLAGHPWLTPIILVTQEVHTRRPAQQIVPETLSQKALQKKGLWSGSRYRP